jgi:hypothetical protein
MFMLLSFDAFAKDLLGACDCQKISFEVLGEEFGRTSETIGDWFKKGAIPSWAAIKFEYRLLELGFEWVKDYKTSAQARALSWRLYCESRLKGGTLFPKTLHRINDLARRDFEFCLGVSADDSSKRFAAYREYLASQVVPLYSRNSDMPLGIHATETETEAEMRPFLITLLVDGILDHLSFAEAEYLTSHSDGHPSVLSNWLPELVEPNGEKVFTPKERFFKNWFDKLGLQPREVVEAVVKKFGEIGVAEEDTEGAVNIEVLSRQLRWCLKDSKMKSGYWPSCALVEKIASALHPFAEKRYGCNISEEYYQQQCLLGVTGSRILDTTLKEGNKFLPAEKLLPLMDSYRARFQVHHAALNG